MQKYPHTCWHVVQLWLWVLIKEIDYTQLATFCKDQPQTWYKMVEVSNMTQNKIGRLKDILTQGSKCNMQHREASFDSQIAHKPFACMSYITAMPAENNFSWLVLKNISSHNGNLFPNMVVKKHNNSLYKQIRLIEEIPKNHLGWCWNLVNNGGETPISAGEFTGFLNHQRYWKHKQPSRSWCPRLVSPAASIAFIISPIGAPRALKTHGLPEVPPPNLTHSPWKMVVGRRSPFLLGFGNFSGENSLLNFGAGYVLILFQGVLG